MPCFVKNQNFKKYFVDQELHKNEFLIYFLYDLLVSMNEHFVPNKSLIEQYRSKYVYLGRDCSMNQ